MAMRMQRTENNLAITRESKAHFSPEMNLSSQEGNRMSLTAYRPMGEQLKTYIHALSGPRER
jgi:hypothetical protein